MKHLILTILLALSSASAQPITVEVRSQTLSIAKIKDLGFDWMFASTTPAKDSAPPQAQSLSASHSLRGLLTPDQAAVITRALSSDGSPLALRLQSTANSPRLIEADQAGQPFPISLQAILSPDGTLKAITQNQEIPIPSGQTLLFTLPSAQPDTVDIYLVTLHKKSEHP